MSVVLIHETPPTIICETVFKIIFKKMRRPLKINELERDSFVKGTFHLFWFEFVAIHFITTVRRNYSLIIESRIIYKALRVA